MEIDTELNEKRTKLQVYEKVEQELDEVVMQAAQGSFQHRSFKSILFISLFSSFVQLKTTSMLKKFCFLMVTERHFQHRLNDVFNILFIWQNVLFNLNKRTRRYELNSNANERKKLKFNTKFKTKRFLFENQKKIFFLVEQRE